MAKTSFDKRVEMKYLLDDCTYHVYKNRISDIMRPDDAFPESRIYNIYYDTPDHLLVRRSLDKPLYKEKLRLRTYGLPESGNADFYTSPPNRRHVRKKAFIRDMSPLILYN